ncbi:hypothetical protein [Anaeromicropila herbilytica]|uniref:Uncharacterized protein n=1 Tax=Anaeromicropila herbilytica TaxID=2785025 RepID=A0A7R7EQ78_9FIRM|nr:hypothetical protein [Anaeromicropila herbilytica]BCN33011.1 hypothetical protein bsdtb5_43060 [Anaeromicropila herbilytica]
MKHKFSFIGFSLFFLLSIMMEAYCLLETRNDLISIIGMGVVVLISAYLVLDVGITQLDGLRKNEANDSCNYESLNKKLEEMENIQKAIYVSTKKSYNLIDDKLFVITKLLEEQKTLNDTIIMYGSKYNEILENIQSSVLKNNEVSKRESGNDNIKENNENQSVDEKLAALDIDMSDPNKKLSPDEIALLFNQLS